MRNIVAIVYDWDDVILRVARSYFQALQEVKAKVGFVGVLTGITGRDKYVNNGVQSDMIINSIAELPVILQSDSNG